MSGSEHWRQPVFVLGTDGQRFWGKAYFTVKFDSIVGWIRIGWNFIAIQLGTA
jgi:hypothetical protein